MGCGSSIAEVEYKAWEAQHVEEIGRELTPEERQEERATFMQRLMGEEPHLQRMVHNLKLSERRCC